MYVFYFPPLYYVVSLYVRDKRSAANRVASLCNINMYFIVE